jgi:hypothetical protein
MGKQNKETKEALVSAFDKITLKEFADQIILVEESARVVNKQFGQTRERIVEIQTAIADTLPGVTRLGGNLSDVSQTINEISNASRRNVIANVEDVESLFAASEILDITVSRLSDSFIDVGVGVSQIPVQLEKSINYIRGIGGNTKQVMDDVVNNMDQMNRYQFKGGVEGLTKMAAQASMLRFDMNETFRLADRVLSPEGAIEVASAFQRLGVAAGDLVDPFALMNQSINDPSGLQTSLANISKQFTYFDEQTKTFKVNPQGVLTLREMEEQAGLTRGSLSKMGLAAAELDSRLSEINKAGLTIASEDDKQYLANIATMQKDGKYLVTLEDGTKKELADLQQPEFNRLIQIQKDAPKTMEEIAKGQMSISETIANDASAIRNAFVGGVVSARPILNTAEGLDRSARTLSGELSSQFSATPEYRGALDSLINNSKTFFEEAANKNIKLTDAASNFFSKLGQDLDKAEKGFKDKLIKVFENSAEKSTDRTAIEREIKQGLENIKKELDSTKVGPQSGGKFDKKSFIEGNAQKIEKEVLRDGKINNLVTSKGQVEIVGRASIDVNHIGASAVSAGLSNVQKEQVNNIDRKSVV